MIKSGPTRPLCLPPRQSVNAMSFRYDPMQPLASGSFGAVKFLMLEAIGEQTPSVAIR